MTKIFNTRILASLGMIVFVAALVASSTGAFFSDTETSTGNTFTAGELDLLVDSTAHYAGLVCQDNTDDQVNNPVWVDDAPPGTTRPDLVGDPCVGSWAETNLGVGHTFFNLGDLKPGDEGENTISLHVENNDAYVCAIIDNLVDADNTCTEPEDGEVGELCTTALPEGATNGELSGEINFFAWAETDGDNIWEVGEIPLFANPFFGPASDVLGGVVYPMFTPQTMALPGDTTTYVGLAWCYGDMTVDVPTATLTCDGGPVTNISQTDSMTADISFYVEQARNNANFQCPSLNQ